MLAMSEENVVLRWSAYEHEHIERGSDWYWALGVVALSVAVTSILFQDFFFALLILLAAGTLALISRTPPEIAHFELSDKGIRINGKMHPYREILAFWVEDDHDDRPMLLVDTTKWLSPNMILPIEHIEPSLVRAYLKERVEERHMQEPFTHKVVEFFGL